MIYRSDNVERVYSMAYTAFDRDQEHLFSKFTRLAREVN